MMRRHRFAFVFLVSLVVAGTLAPLPWIAGCDKQDRAIAEGSPVPTEAQTEKAVGSLEPVGSMPVLLSMDAPKYPEGARSAGTEGMVMVQALVGVDGKVSDAAVVDGPEIFADASLKAVQGATFKPAVKDGQAVAVWVHVPIQFRLGDKDE